MIRSTFHYSALPLVFVLIAAAHRASAQDANYFPDTAVISYAVSGNAVIGYANGSDLHSKANPTNPVISFVKGGRIAGGLQVHNHSKVTVNGGSFAYIAAGDDSAIDLYGTGLHTALANPKGFTIKSRHLIEYKLFGTLADGTSVNGKRLYVQKGLGARFALHNAPRSPIPQRRPKH